MNNCKVIAIANQKGGVAKTTTTANLGTGLCNSDKRVLLIDCDPQGDLTASLGWKDSDDMDFTLSGMIHSEINDRKIKYEDYILHHEEGCDLIPANIELADYDLGLVNVFNREKVLNNIIEPLRERYDYILIDCPPSLNMLTINALSASNEVLIPVQAHFLAAKGMSKLLKTINRVKKQINPKLNITGVVVTIAQMNTNLAKKTINDLQAYYGHTLTIFKSVIPQAINAGTAPIIGVSLFKFDSESKVTTAYESLTKEVLAKHNQRTRNDMTR